MDYFNKYKSVLQYEERDCGVACLATICKQYQIDYSFAELRDLTNTDLNGCSVFSLVNAAEHIGFKAGALQGNYDELLDSVKKNEIRFPFIAHIMDEHQGSHYIVVHEIYDDKIIVADPSEGIKKFDVDQFTSKWTGYVVTFEYAGEPVLNKKDKKKEKIGLWDYFKMFLNKKKALVFVFILSFALLYGNLYSAILSSELYQCINDNTKFIEQPRYAADFEGDIFTKMETSINNFMVKLERFDNVCMVLVGLSIALFLLKCIRGVLVSHLSKLMDSKIMKNLFCHLMDVPLKFFTTYKTGELIARFTDAQYVRTVVITCVVTLFTDGLSIVLIGALLIYVSKKLSIVVLVLLFVYLVCALLAKKPLNNISHRVMEENAQVTAYLKESLSGIESVKSFNVENNNKETGSIYLDRLINSIFVENVIQFIYNNLNELVYLIGTIAIIWVGSKDYFQGEMTAEGIILFLFLTSYFFQPIKSIVGLFPTIQRGVVALKRMKDILDVDVERTEYEYELNKIENEIHINKVNFNYDYGEFSLNDVDMTIKKGEKIAIVGASGSGKSTLAKMLVGFNYPISGDILIDGKPLGKINISDLRKRIIYLSQNIYFFTDSIENNLLMGADCSKEEMIKICKLCEVDEFVSKLPFGYETVMLEEGINFSVGQRQRLAIARALIQNPDVIIFDESTSNLDSLTENAIREAIMTYNPDITYIIIAHRISSIKDCEKIYVMSSGEIVEIGNHESLISTEGNYYQIWKSQCI